jgi:hypothetical protein
MRQVKKTINISRKKIVVFKKSKHAYIGHNAHYKKSLSFTAFGVLDHDARYVVNDDSSKKYKDVYGYERHVKHTTGYQQMKPAKFMRQQKVEDRNYREE